jgi:hypothetical protein
MIRPVSWMALLMLCGSAAVVQAQDRVYRCGSDGRAYSHEPCADGRGVSVGDTRSAQQVAQARQVALRDAREADALERQRVHVEKLAARQGPVLMGPSLKPVRLDDAHCTRDATCAHREPKSRHDKARTVTLYRAGASR